MSNYVQGIYGALGGQGQVPLSSSKFLQGWQKKEGGATNNNATFNWLNRTDSGFPTINKVGVVAYPNFQTGVSRTADLIRTGYPALAKAIRTGAVNLSNPAQQGDLNRWLTGKRTPGASAYVTSVASLMGQSVGAAPASSGGMPAAPTSQPPRQMQQRDPAALALMMMQGLHASRNARSRGEVGGIMPLISEMMASRQSMPQIQAPQQGLAPAFAPSVSADSGGVIPSVLNMAHQFGMNITSGYRSVAKQAQLYANRSAPGSVGAPGKSWHNSGHAVDVTPDAKGKAFLTYAFAHPEQFKEVFFDPAGRSIKNGKIVNYTIGGHSDHIHFAM
jgi:hypothetical protein